MKKAFRIVFNVAALALGGWGAIHAMNSEVECFENQVFLYSLGGTIQGISYRVDDLGSNGLIRGHITALYRNAGMLGGYLDTTNFKEDGLLGLERPNDKEGYFIVRLPTRQVESGLKREVFETKFGKSLAALHPDWQSEYGRKPWTCLWYN